MRLTSIEYHEWTGAPAEWHLSALNLGPINLLVGKNATGKSRTLSVIGALAKGICGKRKFEEADYKITLIENVDEYTYELVIHEGRVYREIFSKNGKIQLERGEDGKGLIDAEAACVRLSFQVPETDLAVSAKRDLIQHPFLEALHNWAQNLRSYDFGGTMGRTNLAIFLPNGPEPDLTDPNFVVAIFNDGKKRFAEPYTRKVVQYFNRIGYDIESIAMADLPNFRMQPQIPGVAVTGIAVKERDRKDMTRNIEMSQGMFRALSCLIQVAYAEFTNTASCICIDDIGEGLDFERSSKLITLLQEVAKTNKIQLIMATNDRFVMNLVPLEAWSILRRNHETCNVLNHENSQELFEEFKLTGLNNFDFFRQEASFANESTP